MTNWQALVIFTYSSIGAIGAIRGYAACLHDRKTLVWTPQFYMYGAFVWGDIVILGSFWLLVGLISLALQDVLLFLTIFSLFWFVRGAGESIFWFLQQYSTVIRYAPHALPGHHIFGDDSIWFVYQVVAQLVTVISLVVSLILVPLWLGSLGIL